MKRIVYPLLALVLLLPSQLFAQDTGIKFFKGTFEEALAEAQKQDKPLFVDFYAVWCGPCKRMAKEVFTQKEVGDYFNQKFINLQLDAEAKPNLEVAKKYKVEAFPTIAFIDKEGKAISISIGAMDKAALLDAAKVAVGEVLGFEALYDMYKKDKNDLSVQQDLLTQAPSFLATQNGMDAERWVVRMRNLYKDYINTKMGDDLINKRDYNIILSLGGDDKELEAKIIDFMNKNLSKWREAAGDAPAYYIIEYNDGKINDLAKGGDPAYREYVEKINGEYKDAYGVVAMDGISPYEKSKLFADALYTLYKEKDVNRYKDLMQQYFGKLGAEADGTDYGRAAQELYNAMGSKLTDADHQTAIEWVGKALQQKNSLMDRINFLVMTGDSYKALKKYDEAQSFYNQAFAETYQFQDNAQTQGMLQAVIVKKLSELDLLRK